MRSGQRRHERVDHVFGLLVIRCPQLHKVGEVALQRGRYTLTSSLTRDDTKVRADCLSDAHTGGRHLQGSWTKIAASLDELVKDPTRGAEDYVIGGTPIH